MKMWRKLLLLLGFRLQAVDPLAKTPEWELLLQRKALLKKEHAAAEARLTAEGVYAKDPKESTRKAYQSALAYEGLCREEREKLEWYLEDKRRLILHNLDAAEHYLNAMSENGPPPPPPLRVIRQKRGFWS